MKRPCAVLLFALSAACASTPERPLQAQAAPAPAATPATPAAAAPASAASWTAPFSEQLALRERWLALRHARLLEQMRRHRVGMWIVVNEEFHDDPLTPYIAPPRPYAGNRDIFVFVDGGERGLQKVALVDYAEGGLERFFKLMPGKPETLAALDKEFHPATIALSIGGTRGVSRSLTRASYQYLVQALGAQAEKRFVPAEALIEEYLDTRLPEELPHYTRMVQLTEQLTQEALSSRFIVPGRTSVGDLRRHLYDGLSAHGVTTWFQPDVRVQRRGEKGSRMGSFLMPAAESVVIQRGDLLHVDFGLTYLGLNTDWQKMAYVLKDGETDAPEGMKRALANTNTLQDALMLRASRPGRLNADVYDATMAEMKDRGITAQVYSHPLGAQGHALGAGIDFRAASRKSPPRPLRLGSYIAIELATQTPVPEWDGQVVFMMAEDPAHLTEQGWRFFVPRQEALYLVR
jgi:Xaa-Pro aminopeptidase